MRLEAAAPAAVLEAIRAPIAAEGAPWLDAPVVQPLAQYLEAAGEAMRERLFAVAGPGPEEMCLRPDFTLAAARAHLASGAAAGAYAYEGHAFRVAPAGEARAEEFLQIGLEAFGEPASPRRDAEMAALAWRAAAAGGRDDLTLLMGDVGLFGAFLESLGVAGPLAERLKRRFASPRRLRAELAAASEDAEPAVGDRLAVLLAGLPEAEATEALRAIWALAGIEPVGGRSAAEIVHRLGERAALAGGERLTAERRALIERFLAIVAAPKAALAQVTDLAGGEGGALAGTLAAWAERLDHLARLGPAEDRMRLSTAFGRDFGYYDGFVFEVRSAALGEGAPAAAGGRYDSLPAKLGGRPGAVGCTVRPGRAWSGGAP